MPQKRIFFSVLIALLIVVGLALASDWRFWQRYLSAPKLAQDLTVAWYQPQQSVPGLKRDFDTNHSGLSPSSRARAVEIAEQYESDALLVAVNGDLVLEQYWNGVDETTPLLTFSFHKTVSAILIGLAIEDGYISSADVKLGSLIPEWKDTHEGNVTLRQTMQMSAGFGHPTFKGGPFSSAAQFYYGSRLTNKTLKAKLEHAPGEVFDYGNRAAQIAGLALQNALPMPYTDYLSYRLWRPIGAGNASVVVDKPGGAPLTYCCLMATARDWLRLGLLLEGEGAIEGESVVPAQWVKGMGSPAQTNPNFGLFLWRGEPHVEERYYSPSFPAYVAAAEAFAVEDVVFMDGAGGQRVYVSSSLDLVVVRLGAYRSDWDDTELFNAIAEDLQKARSENSGVLYP